MRIFALATSLLLATPCFAQIVLPRFAATTDPGHHSPHLFFGSNGSTGNESRTQTIFAASELGTRVLQFKSLQVRRSQARLDPNLPMQGSATLSISSSSNGHRNASGDFQANHGRNRTIVFSGPISLPGRSRSTRWPAPWETAIPFRNPWIHNPSPTGSFVLENEFSGNSSQQPWSVEGTHSFYGERVTNHPPCSRHSGGGPQSTLRFAWPSVGGSWFVNYDKMPSNQPSLNASFQILGLRGVGQAQWGRILPIPLAAFGLPSNGCSLAVSYDFTRPLTYVPSTGGPNLGSLRSTPIPIPNNPGLAGVSFFDQAVGTDTSRTNRPKLYMSWSSRWTVGSGIQVPVTTVYRTGNNSMSGLVRLYEGAVLRFGQ